MGFSRQEYWSGLPFSSPGESSQPRELGSPALQVDSLMSEPPGKPKTLVIMNIYLVPMLWASQVVLVAKNLPAKAGYIRDAGLIPGSGRSTEGGHGNPLQYFYLENPTDRGRLQSLGLQRVRHD